MEPAEQDLIGAGCATLTYFPDPALPLAQVALNLSADLRRRGLWRVSPVYSFPALVDEIPTYGLRLYALSLN